MRQLFLTFILITVLSSCTNSHKNEKIKASEWLIGEWENQSKEGVLNETWSKPNDSTLTAGSFFIKEKDTLHFETITIHGQNNDKPIVFPLLSETENELVFENLQNDYPQKIKYQRNSKTAITISISGKQAKKFVSEQYKMTKIN